MAVGAVDQARQPVTVRSAAWMRGLVTEILGAVGASPAAAAAMADALTEAHLRGVETHGLRRLRPYVARIRAGGVNAAAEPAIERRGAVLRIDGQAGIGHHVAARAADAVAETARDNGIAVALVRNSSHFGFAGHYAVKIAEKRQIGLVVSNGQVCVGPAGARRALLSNNPLAIAAPTGRPDVFLELDLAASVTSRANVVAKAKAGEPLPDGWAQDADGLPTRDGRAALDGSLLAFGGSKGFGLLFALEAITGVLAGGAFADDVVSKDSAPDQAEGTSHTLLAIDLDAAIGADAYAGRLDDLIARLLQLPVRPEARAAVRHPGERRWALRRERLATGIPITHTEDSDVTSLARELGIAVDVP